ncbi:hypothetical protein [Roseibacillus ishigakijimensis]|uniref:Uncharacterized protein n=1 Tax=Roseibacillus ishigakijimensis TaxID=454146 RepID=A0A934RPR0_9BACT|nr:hypothetical protein [Roseibacillus ishigakijimensis]MBK1834698.1 hypothetical protein [Roseibacillus ishigakijimensis]
MKTNKWCQVLVVGSLTWAGLASTTFGEQLVGAGAAAEVDKALTAAAGKVLSGEALAKRVEALGLLATVSKNAAAVSTLKDGSALWKEIEESALGGLLVDTLAENDLDLRDAESPGAQVAALFAEEFIVAMGADTPRQAKNLMTLGNLGNEYQMAMMVSLMFGNPEMLLGGNPFASWVEALQENPDFLVNLAASAEMPPILMAARISDDETRNQLAAMMAGGTQQVLAMAEDAAPFLSAAKAEQGGVNFEGLSIDGNQLITMLEEEDDLHGNLQQIVDPAAAQDIIDSLKKKDLCLMGGVSEEAIYLYLGSRPGDMPFAADPADSVIANADFDFVDEYLDEKLVSVTWANQALVEGSYRDQPLLANYVKGIRMGLGSAESIGDTSKLEAQLDKLLEVEKSYYELYSAQPVGAVTFMRGDGLHTESYGGVIDGSYDLSSEHQLGNLASEGFLTLQAVSSEEGLEVEGAFAEAIFQTAYQALLTISEMEEPPGEMAELAEGVSLFESKMKDDALGLWKGLRMTEEGLGREAILEVDLAGAWPTVPGVPDEVLENTKVPRLSFVSPITDGEKLAESWKTMDDAARKLLKTVSEMTGEKIPMQKPMSSQNDGLKTWFFPIPMQNDDFVPSVTLNEEVMIMSSSKQRAVALAEAAQAGKPGTSGLVMTMNFAPLQAFLSEWLQVIEESPTEVLPDRDAADFFLIYQEEIKRAVEALEEFDSWQVHSRLEDGVLRTSSHFKTK